VIHASVELIDAMKGECPNGDEDRGPHTHNISACTGRNVTRTERVTACFDWAANLTGNAASEAIGVVDCPDCLNLMREADPVRWDACEERGLVSISPRSLEDSST
jgi:hypothetical protein